MEDEELTVFDRSWVALYDCEKYVLAVEWRPGEPRPSFGKLAYEARELNRVIVSRSCYPCDGGDAYLFRRRVGGGEREFAVFHPTNAMWEPFCCNECCGALQ